MQVEIWSDVVCPWCYIGKRRFEAAAGRFAHPEELDVVWRAFELDPNAPANDDRDMTELLATKYGWPLAEARARQAQVAEIAAGEGLEYHLERTRRQRSFDAHRLLKLAADEGEGGSSERQSVLKERLLRAYFTEGRSVTDHDSLLELAGEVGLDREAAAQVLAGDRYGDEVRSDEARATELGAHGVPYFLVDGKYAVSGAQDSARFLQLLDRAWLDRHPPETASASRG